MNPCTNTLALCVCFVAISENPPPWPALKHEPWLCRTDYAQNHCYSPHPAAGQTPWSFAHTNTTAYWTSSPLKNHHACLSTHSPFKMLFCHFSTQHHNNEQKQPSKWWVGRRSRACLIFLLYGGSGKKYPWVKNIGHHGTASSVSNMECGLSGNI